MKTKVLVVIFLIALTVRIIYTVFFFGLDVLDPDSYHYDSYAMNLIRNKVYVDNDGNYSFRAPGYPFFLAGIYCIFGHSYPVVKIIQVIMSAFICVIIYLIAFEISGRKIATISSFFSCFYYGLFEMPAHILSETSFTFLLCISILLFLKIDRKPSYKVLGAIFLGLATLTRPITLMFPFFLCVWLLLKYQLKDATKNILLIVIPFILTISPWTIRNYFVHRDFVPINIQAGFDFWASNNAYSKGQWNPAHLDLEKYKNLPEAKRDKQYFKEGLMFLRSQTLFQNMKSALLKIGSFLYPFLPQYELTFGLILPFWFLGMYLVIKSRDRHLLLLLLVILLFFFITIIWYGSPRFRGPMSPFIIIFGAIGINSILDKFKKRIHLYVAFVLWLFLNILIFLHSEPIRLIVKKIREI